MKTYRLTSFLICSNTVHAKKVFLPHGCFYWIILMWLQWRNKKTKKTILPSFHGSLPCPRYIRVSSDTSWAHSGQSFNTNLRAPPCSLSLSRLQQMPRMSVRKLPWFRPMMKQHPSGRQALENKVLEQYLVQYLYSSKSNYIYTAPKQDYKIIQFRILWLYMTFNRETLTHLSDH